MEKTFKAIALAGLLQQEMGRSFPFIVAGPDEMLSKTSNPDASAIQQEVHQILAGSLIVYLFAMWDQYVSHDDVQKFLRPEEQRRFFAFKHLRIVAAHNIDGDRRSNKPDKHLMDHAEKLNSVMASARPISGVDLSAEKVVIGPDAALDCRDFLQGLALKLPGRYAVDGPHGKVRGTGGAQHDVF